QCDTAVSAAAACHGLYLAKSGGGRAFCGASHQCGIGGMGRGAEERPEHDVFSAGNAGVWRLCTAAFPWTLWRGGAVFRAGFNGEATSDHAAFRAFALGLLAFGTSSLLCSKPRSNRQ